MGYTSVFGFVVFCIFLLIMNGIVLQLDFLTNEMLYGGLAILFVISLLYNYNKTGTLKGMFGHDENEEE